MVVAEERRLRWENAAAGAIAGFTTVASLHPLDVVRTRFQGLSLSLSLSHVIEIWRVF
jgi:Mitochondrial carrier protein